MSGKNLLRVRVTGSEKALGAFLAVHPPGCERIERAGESSAIELFIPAHELDAWRRNRELDVKVLYGAATRMKRLVKEIGKGDRFTGGKVPRLPTGGGV